MKKYSVIILVSLVVSSAWAQYFEMGGGLVVSGDNDHFDTGAGVFGYCSVYPSPVFSARGTALVWGGNTSGDVLSHGDYVVGGFEGTLIAHAEPSEWCRLRAGVGGGAYFIDTDDGYGYGRYSRNHYHDYYDDYREDIDDELGVHVLAGADLVIYANMSFFLEVKHIFLDSDVRIREYNEDTNTYETRDEELELDTTSVNLGFKMLF